MGTKNKPAPFDCYANAMPDEPMFILLARDPKAADLVRGWARSRKLAIHAGDRPVSDMAMVSEAMECAKAMEKWRKEHDGEWRKPVAEVATEGQGRRAESP